VLGNAGRRTPVIVIAGVVGVVVVLVGVRLLSGGADDDDASGSSGASTTSTTEDEPFEPPTTQGVPVLTVPPPPDPLPGLQAAAIREDLAGSGYTCSPSPDFQAERHEVLDCTIPGVSASLRIYARTDGQVVALEVFAFSDADRRWLTWAATRPWTGADPAAAQAWVEQTTAAGGTVGGPAITTTIGGRRLALTSTGDFWTLVVGTAPYTT
jgi:hypothetical protein